MEKNLVCLEMGILCGQMRTKRAFTVSGENKFQKVCGGFIVESIYWAKNTPQKQHSPIIAFNRTYYK